MAMVWVAVDFDQDVLVDTADFEEVDEDTLRKEKALIDAEAFDSHYAQVAWEATQVIDDSWMWSGNEPPF